MMIEWSFIIILVGIITMTCIYLLREWWNKKKMKKKTKVDLSELNAMYEFHTGDKVVVKTYPVSHVQDDMPLGWVKDMYYYMGKTLIITHIDNNLPNIRLENGYWYYEYQLIPYKEYVSRELIKYILFKDMDVCI